MSDSDDKPNAKSIDETIRNTLSLDETPWIKYAAQQVQLLQKNVEQSMDSAFVTAKTRISEIRSTSSAHFNQTLDSLQEVKAECSAYEDLFFAKLKEGVDVAASNPGITCGLAFGLGILAFKGPRRFLTSRASRLFVNEETLLARADARAKELKDSISILKSEGEKLEKEVLQAQEELKRGKTKLRQAGKQIRSLISTAYKTERQARGLKDIVGELPSSDASRFRAEISKLASEAKKERTSLDKEVSKIINYGISI